MAHLALSLLGLFQAQMDGLPLNGFESDKARALLAFLAVEGGQPQVRETLAGLLWPDFPQENAQANLRVVISRLRKLLGDKDAAQPFLLVTRNSVCLNAQADCELDTAEFENLVDPHQLIRPHFMGKPENNLPAGIQPLVAAVDLWRGPFLEGLSLPDCPELDDWILIKREHFSRLAMKALHEITAGLAALAQYEMALPYAWQQVRLEPWQEEAHQHVMRLLALTGQRSTALAQYEQCRKILRAELGVEPGAETAALAEAIHRGDLAGIQEMSLPSITPVALELVPPEPGPPPFKGLQFFDEADAGIYFGRQALISRLVRHIFEMAANPIEGEEDKTSRVLAVVGASGSGKSSVVRAGLIPVLKGTIKLEDGKQPPPGSASWLYHILIPTAHPLESLADGLGRDARQSVKTLLVIDQFEELFTLCHSEDERAAFLDQLMNASNFGGVLLVIVLRADFYAHCARYPRLREALSARQVFIGPMSAAELRQAIEEPARLGGWEFAPGLVDLILRDVGASEEHPPEPGALPLLEHVLLETWERRRGRTLTLQGYADAGGVQGAIAHTAESVFHCLSAEQQALARRIFLRLTELGEGTQDTRRRAAISELVSTTAEVAEVESLLKELADARLITLSEGVAEVAHEALIREWPSLRAWLSEDRESLRLHRRLAAAAQDWENLSRDSGVLYRGAPLAQALEWVAQPGRAGELNALEQAFLGASQTQAEGEARQREEQRQRELEAAQILAETERKSARRLRTRNRVITGIGAVALALAAAAGIFGYNSNRNAVAADQQRNAAQQEASTRATAEARAQAEALSRATAEANAVQSYITAERSRMAALALNSYYGGLSGEVTELLALRSMLDYGYSPEADLALMQGLRRGFAHTVIISEKPNCCFAVDGAFLGSSNRVMATLQVQSNYVGIWNASTGSLIRKFGCCANITDNIRTALSPDGTQIATIDNSGGLYLWDPETGAQIKTITTIDRAFSTELVFSPDGRRLATGGSGYSARIWDIQTGKELQAFFGHADAVASVKFSPDGKYLLTGSKDKTIMLWDVHSGVLLRQFTGHTDLVNEVDFSPDGPWILSASQDKTVRVWETATGKVLRTLQHTAAVRAASFSPDGSLILTGGGDLAARLWDAASGTEVKEFTGHKFPVVSVAFSADGHQIVTTGDDGYVMIWDVGLALGSRLVVGTHSVIEDTMTFSPDGSLALVYSQESQGLVTLLDVKTGKQLRQLSAPWVTYTYISDISQDGKLAITSHLDQKPLLWDLQTGLLIRQIQTPDDWTFFVQFSRDGRKAATLGLGHMCLWDVPAGRQVACVAHTQPVTTVEFSPDGKLLAIGHGESMSPMVIWDIANATIFQTLCCESTIQAIAFSPDGKTVVSAGDPTLHLWSLETGKEIRQFSGHSDVVDALRFSHDGRYIASGSVDKTVRIWDAATGQEIRRLPGDQTWVTNLQFSADDTYLYVASASESFESNMPSVAEIREWRVDLQAQIKQVCAILPRDFTPEERTRYGITGDKPTCPAAE